MHCANQGLSPALTAQPQSQGGHKRLLVNWLQALCGLGEAGSQGDKGCPANTASLLLQFLCLRDIDYSETSCCLEWSHRPLRSLDTILQLLQAAKICLPLISMNRPPCAAQSMLLPVWIGRSGERSSRAVAVHCHWTTWGNLWVEWGIHSSESLCKGSFEGTSRDSVSFHLTWTARIPSGFYSQSYWNLLFPGLGSWAGEPPEKTRIPLSFRKALQPLSPFQ
uniref:Uncharacterized protein n=1 Tax=Rousettus aegyptiacus TaxID=9407 RepID=A0A7J8CI26_ROUAE|nr:hypothetical protein HJG63_009054 [Rousettus aegyptiacus]